jgi:hypothetical protein
LLVILKGELLPSHHKSVISTEVERPAVAFAVAFVVAFAVVSGIGPGFIPDIQKRRKNRASAPGNALATICNKPQQTAKKDTTGHYPRIFRLKDIKCHTNTSFPLKTSFSTRKSTTNAPKRH